MSVQPSYRLALAAAVALPAAVAFTGCTDDANTEAGQTAQQAVGVEPGTKTTKTVEQKRDVIIKKEEEVVDAKTGEVLSDTKSATPVTITQEKEVKTDVKVNVGDQRVESK